MKSNEIDYARPMFWGFLWWATVAYIILEIFINVIVFRQLSFKSDFLTVESIAFWGKIITGISAALALTKMFYGIKIRFGSLNYKNLYATDSAKIFLLFTVVCIPASFYLQNLLIDTIVESASPDEKNKAVLVINAQSTMKPHYQPSAYQEPTIIEKLSIPITGMKDSFMDNYEQKQNVWFSASSRCIEGSAAMLGITSNIDKAFFAYNSLNAPINEDLYKEVITKYHSCILKKPVYQRLMWPNPKFDDSKLREFYADYTDKSAQYVAAKRKENESSWGVFSSDQVDTHWNKEVNKLLGFEASVKPNLSYDEFVKHPDLQEYFKRKLKPENERMVPYSKWFVFELRHKMAEASQNLLPNSVIPTYVSEGSDKPLGSLIEYPSEYKGDKVEVTQAQIEESGQRAYRAIVMPMIALGASLIFLLINLIILASQIIVRQVFESLGMVSQPMFTEVAMSILLAMLVFWLPIRSINIEAAESNQSLTNIDRMVKFVYHYESR
ncbi:MAG: hypothetical protein J6N72_06825, partial [Psychrobacter sp.]|nr:hypothetical protein [Psychrobacter sp.]